MKTSRGAPADELVRGLDEYAALLRCCVPTIRRLLASHVLPGRKIGNSYMTTRAALLEAIAKQVGDHAA